MVSPLGAPWRLAASVGSSIEAAGELPAVQQKVLEHLRSMDQVLSEHLGSMDRGIEAVRELIEPMRGVPDPDAPGPIARDTITGDQ
ncbi:MAG: hypothetical protein ACR2J6_04190 [Thermoleophilaceae bacterium]